MMTTVDPILGDPDQPDPDWTDPYRAARDLARLGDGAGAADGLTGGGVDYPVPSAGEDGAAGWAAADVG